MRQAFWPPSLQMRARSTQNVCLAHQERKSTQRFQGLQAVSGPQWLWQIQSKRSLETRVLVGFRKALEKTRLQIELLAVRVAVFCGPGCWGGRLWLFWAAGLAGGAAGRSAAASAVEKTVLRAFWRLRVGKSSTRMANRCPRILDAGGKGRDQVGC